MNIALSLLSAAANNSETAGVIDKLQSYTATDTQSIAQQQIADPNYWGTVGIISLTGILVVFFILAILIFVFWLMGRIFQTINNSKNKKAEAEKAAKAAAAPAAPAPAPAPVVEEAAADTDSDEEIMAVISAAIAAYAAEEGTAYTIRNVKRRDSRTRSAWSLAGIGENTRPF
ncbi:MAG: OadG family protein [Oscillospiraceae bacterium]